MFKKVKARTIIFALIIGIVVVGILGGFYLSMIKEIIQMSSGNVVDIINQANIIKKQTEISILVAMGVLIIFALIISKVLSKYVIYPKNKFIKSDEKTELKDKLSEVSTKKNQIETILLHMTDGIIAFDREGKIIYQFKVFGGMYAYLKEEILSYNIRIEEKELSEVKEEKDSIFRYR